MRPLLPHQKSALRYCAKQSDPALFMEMRLGKTKTAIEWLRRQGARRVLIVAPKTVLIAWQDEWLAERLPARATKDWVLINYELLRRRPELLEQDWDALVLDESTKIKNVKAGISKLLLRNRLRAKRRLILSGLPNPEGYLDLISQLLFLDGQVLGCHNFWSFRMHHCYRDGFDWGLKQRSKLKLEAFLAARCFRLTKEQAGLYCPIVHARRYLPLELAQKKLLRELDRSFAATVAGKRYETSWIVVREMWYAQIAGGYFKGVCLSNEKLAELVYLFHGELSRESVVVWFRFVEELERVKAGLAAKGIPCAAIWGATSQIERRRIVHDFQSGRCRILLIQVNTGLYGLDLSKASTAIYYSCGYSHEHRRQSEERLLHPQKRAPSLIIDLICEGSTDEAVLASQQEKDATARRIFELYEGTSQNFHRSR